MSKFLIGLFIKFGKSESLRKGVLLMLKSAAEKSEYDEVAGFSIWGGLWGNSGKIAPLYPKGASEQTVNVRANQPELPDDVPF